MELQLWLILYTRRNGALFLAEPAELELLPRADASPRCAAGRPGGKGKNCIVWFQRAGEGGTERVGGWVSLPYALGLVWQSLGSSGGEGA